jgi:hypothetical protein
VWWLSENDGRQFPFMVPMALHVHCTNCKDTCLQLHTATIAQK